MINSRFDYKIQGSGIAVSCPDFDLSQTLDCGQAFRFSLSSGKWTGAALNKTLSVYEKDGTFVFENTTEADFLSFWYKFFDFETDYSEIKKEFLSDPTMNEAIKAGSGIRILRQDGFETLISFIMSQNNNIPRIKGMLSRFVESFGGFPTPGEVADSGKEKLAPVRAGFREKYILAAARAAADGAVDFGFLQNAGSPIDECRKMLTAISGVGPKVADCVLLFGCGKKESFPLDVWIKRILKHYYPDGFPFIDSPNAGVAQQYLFYWGRELAEFRR
ncbi:MAG: DNA-3-methyladenine glycosylase 2 family protein [Ruminococcus sp.]|jgi:N-glycosylase/DNA lyase|nr:DNA-3-methyladenine glycosylase 2 family protein [Ruminococcus sp.]